MNLSFNLYINIADGVEKKVRFHILIIVHTNGDLSHFARVGIFNQGLHITDLRR